MNIDSASAARWSVLGKFDGIDIIDSMAIYDDFEKLDIRVGKIVDVQDFPEARKPAYKLLIDFGDAIGVKKSSAQLPQNYSKDELLGKQVLAVVNFPPRQIGPVKSEVLTLGVPDGEGNCVLITTDREVSLGGRLFWVWRLMYV